MKIQRDNAAHFSEVDDDGLFQLIFNNLKQQKKIEIKHTRTGAQLIIQPQAGSNSLGKLFSEAINQYLKLTQFPVTVTDKWVNDRFTYQYNHANYNEKTMGVDTDNNTQSQSRVTVLPSAESKDQSSLPSMTLLQGLGMFWDAIVDSCKAACASIASSLSSMTFTWSNKDKPAENKDNNRSSWYIYSKP